MNIRQQLNNSFFALFIAALLIGAKDNVGIDHVTIQSCFFIVFFFFFRIKLYLDDNYNLSDSGTSSKEKDFVLGYITTIISWVFFPIAAYRIWEKHLVETYKFLLIGLIFCSVWTATAAFIGNTPERKSKNKLWLALNFVYAILFVILINNIEIANLISVKSQTIQLFISILLCAILIGDYAKSETFKNIL